MAYLPRIQTNSAAGIGIAMAAVVVGAGLAAYAALAPSAREAAPPGREIRVQPLLIDAREFLVPGALSLPADGGAPPSVVRPDDTSGRLALPAFGVNADIQEMGFERGTGQMEIPGRADLVAWYGFTAAPGQPGNAVFAAHVDFRGERGAFHNLHDLRVGDEVAVEFGGTVYHYRVVEAYLVHADEADMAAIIGQRAGSETVTLITCGGNYDRWSSSYDQRVIVRAERVHGGPGA